MNQSLLKDDLSLLFAEASARNLNVSDPNRARTQESAIVNLARVLDLGIERTLLLLLKARWESFRGSHPGAETWLGGNALKAQNHFDPDPEGMLDRMKREGLWSPDFGHEFVSSFIQEAILNRIHQAPIRSPECERFVVNTQAEQRVSRSADPEAKERLIDARSRWILRCALHADLLLAMVNQQMANARITQGFMQVYGDLYIELRSLESEKEGLLARIALKRDDLSLTRDEMEECLRNSDEKIRKEIEEMTALALVLPPFPVPELGSITAKEAEEYRQEVKTVLRRVWKLLHPDRLAQHEGYEAISPQQRRRLKELWNEIVKVRPDELAFGPHQLGYHQRSLDRIFQMEREARAILEDIPGIDLDPKYTAQGKTPEERIQWYENQCRLLDGDTEEIRAHLKAKIDDVDIAERRALLASSEIQREKLREQMAAGVKQLHSEVAMLQDQLDHLF
jgi:hypothetical protein